MKRFVWLLLLCGACATATRDATPPQLPRADRAHLAWVVLASLAELDDARQVSLPTVMRLRERTDALVREDEHGAILLDLDPAVWMQRPLSTPSSIARADAEPGERAELERAFTATHDEALACRLAAIGGWSTEFLQAFHELALPRRDGSLARPYRDALANDPELARRALPMLMRDLALLERCEMAAIALSRSEYDARLAFEAVVQAAVTQIDDERTHPREQFFCIANAEDWERYMSYPDAGRALDHLGPRVLPVALEFLERN